MKSFKQFLATEALTKKKQRFSVGQRIQVRGKMGRQFKKVDIPVKGKIVSIEDLPSGDQMLSVDWLGRMDMRGSKILASKVKAV